LRVTQRCQLSAQHHVLGLQTAHLFVSTLTALLLCMLLCLRELRGGGGEMCICKLSGVI
jgi:hypothetical protein